MALIVAYVLCIALAVPLISAQTVMTFNEQVLYIISQSFPKLNSTCVAEGCPELNSPALCPTTDGTIPVAIVNIANTCMTRPMCGFVMDPDILPEVTFQTEGKKGFYNATICSLLKGGSYDNASHAQLTDTSETPQQVNMSLFMPDLTVFGPMSCDGGQLNLTFNHDMTFNYTIVYDKLANNVTVVDPRFTLIYISYDMISLDGNITQSFTDFDPLTVASEGVFLNNAYQNFLVPFYQAVFEVASNNCPIIPLSALADI